MNLGELEQKIQNRQNQEKALLEQEMLTSLENFKQNLHEFLKSVTHSIENDMKMLEKRNHALLKLSLKTYLIYITGFSLFMALTAGGVYFLKVYMKDKIQTLKEEITALEIQEEKQKENVAKLNLWGITIVQSEKGRFIVLPDNVSCDTNWTVGKQKAIRIYK